MDSDLEKKLVACCQNGDRSAYSKLVDAYSGQVFAICLGMLGRTHDAEDLAQQVLLKGFTDISRLRNSQAFGMWIGKIAKNLCIDLIRRQKRKANDLALRASEAAGSAKEYPQLQAALAKLPEQHRMALMLYYFEARNSQAIAEILQITPDAVHTRISRARKQLRQLLEVYRR